MGEVFEAVRTGPGGFRRPVALKRLAPDAAIRGDAIARFLAEARILARLDHPNVIDVHDVVAGAGGYVIVMELLRGAPLAELVRAAEASGGMTVAEVIAVADQALAGLAYVHAARDEAARPLDLVHRDITPANLFVTDAGAVKLIDFGIAKLRDAAPLTRDGEVHGTLELIAPERARGEPADATSDLYQLAASLYWALTGRYPHGRGNHPELLGRAAFGTPEPLGALRADLPPALVAAIERAMQAERTARFADAAAMRAALRTPAAEVAAGIAALAARVAGRLGDATVTRDDVSVPAARDARAGRGADVDPGRDDASGAAAGAAPRDRDAAAPDAELAAADRAADAVADGVAAADRDVDAGADGVAARDGVAAADRDVDAGADGGAARDGDAIATVGPPARRSAGGGDGAEGAARRREARGGDAGVSARRREARGGDAEVSARRRAERGGDADVTAGAPARSVAARRRRRQLVIALGFVAAATAGVVVQLAWPRDTPRATTRSGLATVVLPAAADRPLLGAGISSDGKQLAVATGTQVIRLGRDPGAPSHALPIAASDVLLVGNDGALALAGQGDDGRWSSWQVTGTAPSRPRSRDDHQLVRYSPDGARFAYAYRNGDLYLEAATLVDVGAGEAIVAAAWSPDASSIAVVRAAPTGDASIELVALAPIAPPRVLHRRPFPEGEPRVFGWLDPTRLAYAANTADGVAIYQLTLAGIETLVGVDPGHVVTAGGVGGGALALVRGTPRPAGTPIAAATSVAGWLDATLVVGPTTLAGALPADRPITVAAPAVIALRAEPTGVAAWRLGPEPRRLATATGAIRCALDRAAPCVAAVRAGDSIEYRSFDPVTGALGDRLDSDSIDATHAYDHAVDAAGALAIVDGTARITLPTGKLVVPGNPELDGIAWAGRDLVVTGRHWRGHPWVALRVDPTGVTQLLAWSSSTWTASIRATATDVALARTDLALELVVVDVP
jgi:hypothetical protein